MRGLELSWSEVLPGRAELGRELLARWSEPHRRYHDTGHLAAALRALDELGGTSRTEQLAVWFHDAIHTGTRGSDERASAALAGERLSAAGLPPVEVAEVQRLVLVTTDHSPAPGDAAGARVSDADLAILAAEPERYLASVAALRAEAGAGPSWAEARRARVAELLAAEPLFHTVAARHRWLARARANLRAEQAALLIPG